MFIAAASGAQNYPVKPVRLVSPYPPGGANDILARIIGPETRRKPRPADRDRKPRRRDGQHRRGVHGQGRARWLYDIDGAGEQSHDQREPDEQDAVTIRSGTWRPSRSWRRRPTCWSCILRCRYARSRISSRSQRPSPVPSTMRLQAAAARAISRVSCSSASRPHRHGAHPVQEARDRPGVDRCGRRPGADLASARRRYPPRRS